MTNAGSGSERGAYILGVDQEELDRLRFQHKAWTEQAFALFRRAPLRTGMRVLDLGCGPGFTSLELGQVVGERGRVIARDQSQRFLAFLQAECARRSVTNVETSLGPVEELDLAPGSLDAVYARWLFCWLADPHAVMARVAAALKDGGVVLVQDYVDWGAMKLIPHSEPFARSVAACMRSWREGGGTIDIADQVPSLAARAGLEVVHFQPCARLGGVGSLEWRWVEEFHRSYLPRLVERGMLAPRDLEEHAAEWRARTHAGTSFFFTPVMADVVLRKPARS